MLCRVEMPTNEQIYARFYRYKLLHTKGGGGRMALILMPILVVILMFFMWSTGVPLPLILLLVAAAAAYYFYVLQMKPTQLFRAKSGAALQTEVTIFTDNGLNRTVRGEDGSVEDTSSMQYNTLVSAAETNSDFYLFTSPTQAYLIDKNYFTKGSPEELRATLQSKMGAKFKGKK